MCLKICLWNFWYSLFCYCLSAAYKVHLISDLYNPWYFCYFTPCYQKVFSQKELHAAKLRPLDIVHLFITLSLAISLMYPSLWCLRASPEFVVSYHNPAGFTPLEESYSLLSFSSLTQLIIQSPLRMQLGSIFNIKYLPLLQKIMSL